MTTTSKPMPLTEVDPFPGRHIGPSAAEQQAMLDVLGYRSLDEFIEAVVPGKIRFRGSLKTGRPRTEHDVLAELRTMVATNKVFRSFSGTSSRTRAGTRRTRRTRPRSRRDDSRRS